MLTPTHTNTQRLPITPKNSEHGINSGKPVANILNLSDFNIDSPTDEMLTSLALYYYEVLGSKGLIAEMLGEGSNTKLLYTNTKKLVNITPESTREVLERLGVLSSDVVNDIKIYQLNKKLTNFLKNNPNGSVDNYHNKLQNRETIIEINRKRFGIR